MTPLQLEEQDETAVLDLLVSEREGALAEATRLRNQLHQLLLQLDPEYARHLPTLTSQAGLRAVAAYTTADGSAGQQQRAAAVRRLAQRRPGPRMPARAPAVSRPTPHSSVSGA